MTTLLWIIVSIVWILSGIHSAWFLVKRYTLYEDFTNKEIPMLIVCIILPFLTHLATIMTYPKKSKILFKKS
jgi:hypothetical protein